MSDLDTQVIDFLHRVTSAMGLNLDASVEETPDHVRINLNGDDADVLLKKKGEALDALQVIVNTAFRRDTRGDKDEELRQMAKLLIDKAKATGVPQELGPLNPYARRIVHLVVAEDESMMTESIGDAFLKTVVISQAKAAGR